MFVVQFIIAIFLGGYIILNVHLFFERRKYRHMKSPKVAISPIWFLGNLPEFRKLSQEKGGQVLCEILKIYQKWDLIYLPIIMRHVVLCRDLQIISRITNDRTTFPKSLLMHKIFSSIDGVRIFGKYGLLSEPGTDVWHAKRRILDPAFHKTFLKTIMVDMNVVADNLIKELKCRDQGPGCGDVCDDFNRAAFEAISICGFNWSTESVQAHGELVSKAVSITVQALSLAFKENPLFRLPWVRREEKKLVRANMIPAREVAKKHLLERLGSASQGDILSYIIKAHSCSDDLTIDDLVDEYIVFIGAGMETTAITMAVTLFYLTAYPGVYSRVREEVDRIFGDKSEATFEDLNDMKYLDMVIKECLRLKVPIQGTSRVCGKDGVVINNTPIPKGAELYIPIAALQRDPKYWEDPEHFNPERFSQANISKIKSYTYMPFFVGQRSCIGKNFAMLEIKIIISRIVREFEVLNVGNLKDIELAGGITVRPTHPVRVKFTPRGDRM